MPNYLSSNSRYKMQILLIFLVSVNLVVCSKYSKNANKDEMKPFRLNKHNLLWEKAKKKLDATELEHLRVDLKKLDKISLELKHAKKEHRDEMGDLEAEARRSFIEITEKYGIISNDVKDEEYLNRQQFNHAKVRNLWEKAMYEGSFQQDELEELKKELDHHEEKIKEYHLLSDLISKHDSVSDNDIASHDRPSQSELKRKKRELKDKFHDINKHYDNLNDKIQKRLPSPVEEFRDPRVLDLWRKAHNMEFSKEELDSIREELKHFQKRIDKHNHWKDEHAKYVGKGEDKDNNEAFSHISGKLQEHGKLVKKYHATMIDRVFKRDEL